MNSVQVNDGMGIMPFNRKDEHGNPVGIWLYFKERQFLTRERSIISGYSPCIIDWSHPYNKGEKYYHPEYTSSVSSEPKKPHTTRFQEHKIVYAVSLLGENVTHESFHDGTGNRGVEISRITYHGICHAIKVDTKHRGSVYVIRNSLKDGFSSMYYMRGRKPVLKSIIEFSHGYRCGLHLISRTPNSFQFLFRDKGEQNEPDSRYLIQLDDQFDPDKPEEAQRAIKEKLVNHDHIELLERYSNLGALDSIQTALSRYKGLLNCLNAL